jgi:hypothetical protein
MQQPTSALSSRLVFSFATGSPWSIDYLPSGLLVFAAEEALRGLSYAAVLPGDVLYWHKRLIAVSSMVPAVWVAFSLAYARVDGARFVSRARALLLTLFLGPPLFALFYRKELFTGTALLQGAARWVLPMEWPGRALKLVVLMAAILILFNLERTIRSSTGRMRWQIKFMAWEWAGYLPCGCISTVRNCYSRGWTRDWDRCRPSHYSLRISCSHFLWSGAVH